MELEETKIGRLDHKIEKLERHRRRIPGVEFLRTDASQRRPRPRRSTEYAPFGVIGAITPVTHSLPTLAGNAINMLAAGNTVVCQPAPVGARSRRRGRPPLQPGDPRGDRHRQPDHDHRPADARVGRRRSSTTAACSCSASPAARPSPGPPCAASKRAIVAGPGNPPVVVDETADLDNAAQSIIEGGALRQQPALHRREGSLRRRRASSTS